MPPVETVPKIFLESDESVVVSGTSSVVGDDSIAIGVTSIPMFVTALGDAVGFTSIPTTLGISNDAVTVADRLVSWSTTEKVDVPNVIQQQITYRRNGRTIKKYKIRNVKNENNV